MISTLVRKKLILQSYSSQDRRKIMLSLTELGLLRFQELRSSVRSKIEEHVMLLSAQEIEDLDKGIEVLGKLFPQVMPQGLRRAEGRPDNELKTRAV
jgi:DNA-binding MarR family transcriptional regulator